MEQQPSPDETRRALLCHLAEARKLLAAEPEPNESAGAVRREALRLITRARLLLAPPS